MGGTLAAGGSGVGAATGAASPSRWLGAIGLVVDEIATTCSLGALAFVMRPVEEAARVVAAVPEIYRLLAVASGDRN